MVLFGDPSVLYQVQTSTELFKSPEIRYVGPTGARKHIEPKKATYGPSAYYYKALRLLRNFPLGNGIGKIWKIQNFSIRKENSQHSNFRHEILFSTPTSF